VHAWTGPIAGEAGNHQGGEAPKAEAPKAEAQRLADEAARAYRLRDFATTIERLDRAYSLTGEMALLYELGDAHERYYEIDHNPDHLRQARAFFRTFARRSEAATLDPRDAWERVASLSQRISTAPASVPLASPKNSLPPPVTVAATCPSEQEAEAAAAQAEATRGRTQRRSDIGVALFGAGGALMIPGIVLGAVFYAEGRELTRQSVELSKLGELDECGIGCDVVTRRIERVHQRGLLANRAAATGTALAAIGGIMVAAGLSIQIYDRSARDRQSASVRVAPGVGGLSLLGRF